MMDTVKVFDTWVEIKGKMLHFDVMTTNEATALREHQRICGELGSIRRLRSRRRNVSSAIRNHW
ncbi:MAG: DUF2024 family protein [Nitrospiraceae bacterium]